MIKQTNYPDIELDNSEKDVVQLWQSSKYIDSDVIQIERSNIPALIQALQKELPEGKNELSEGSGTGLKIRGFIHEHPKYDKNGNWNTEVKYGDTLVCGFVGFGSECLKYGHRYIVINDNNETKLKAENGDIIDAWNTKNTMPFFVKILRR